MSKCKREKWSKSAEMRAVWTTKTQTSSSTSALSSTFFLFLSPFDSHSLSPCPLHSLSFICRSERSPSRLIFHLAEGARVLVLSAQNRPSLIPPQITIFLHPFIQYLSFFYHLSTLLLFLSHKHMQSCSLSQCQKWRIPKTAVFPKYHKFVFCH